MRVRVPGVLDSFNLSAADAEALIMNARIAAGWIEAPEPEPVVEFGPPCESCDFKEVPADAKECPNCGAEFEEEEDTGS